MNNKNIITKDAENFTLTFERTFDAPRSKVWAAFTSADQFAQWWGPRGWKTTVKEFDFKPGGVLVYVMKCVDKNQGEWFGKESWGRSEFETIDAENGFTYTDKFADDHGNPSTEITVATKVEMEFEDLGDKTKVISRSIFENKEAYDQVINMGVVDGFSETWDRLAEFVE